MKVVWGVNILIKLYVLYFLFVTVVGSLQVILFLLFGTSFCDALASVQRVRAKWSSLRTTCCNRWFQKSVVYSLDISEQIWCFAWQPYKNIDLKRSFKNMSSVLRLIFWLCKCFWCLTKLYQAHPIQCSISLKDFTNKCEITKTKTYMKNILQGEINPNKCFLHKKKWFWEVEYISMGRGQ